MNRCWHKNPFLFSFETGLLGYPVISRQFVMVLVPIIFAFGLLTAFRKQGHGDCLQSMFQTAFVFLSRFES